MTKHYVKAGLHGEVKVTFDPKVVAELDIPWNEETLLVDVSKSGAFDYGNGTSTTVTRMNDTGEIGVRYFDTRYCKGDFENLIEDLVWTIFGENAERFEIVKIENVERDV